MSAPAIELGILVDTQHAIAARGVTEEQFPDAAVGNCEARDAVPREHHVQAAHVQVELIGVGPPRKRMVDQHDRALKPLKAVTRLDEHVREGAR